MKINLSLIIAILCFASTAHGQLYMDSGGDVRIGGSGADPTYKLQVVGSLSVSCQPGANSGFYFQADGTYPAIQPQWNNSARCGLSSSKFWRMYTNYMYYDYLIDISDMSTKENIRSIESPLSSVLKIKGIKYDRKADYYANTMEEDMEKAIESGKNKYGIVAQDLMEIYPDLVKYDEDAQLHGVNYIGLIPILVEAIKEQQVQIEALQEAISGNLKSATSATSGSDPILPEVGSSTLHQNAPNPFTVETNIAYSLSESVRAATLYIYNMTGKQLRSYDIYDRGDSKITIAGRDLDAGMYMYSLIADGILVGTKQMLLTD
jgi:hypothetical protein